MPKPVAAHGPAALDSRGAFVLQTADALIVWVGIACPDAFATAGECFARQLVRYEGAAGPPTRVCQGAEPPAFWAALARLERSTSSGATAAQAARGDNAAVENAGPMLGGGVEVEEAASRVAEHAEYDRDYELYHRSLTARSSGDSGDSARSAKKTPRDEPGCGGAGAPSPNDRQRKHARGGEQQQQQQLDQQQQRQQQEQVGRQDVGAPADVATSQISSSFVPGAPLTRSRSRSPCKSPCKSPSRNRRLSRRQSALLERGLSELERGISMDSAQQAVERTEQQIEALEAAEHAPSPLLRAASDVTPPRDGSLTARSTGADGQQQQVAGGGVRPAVPRINLQKL